jgi:hypothetical protein
MSFENQIQQWVSIDNQLRIVNDKAKELRDAKNALCKNITTYVETNNLSAATVQISDGRLKFVETKTAAPLTYKHLEKCLAEIIKNEHQVKQIVDYVKQNREIKVASEIKRFSNN